MMYIYIYVSPCIHRILFILTYGCMDIYICVHEERKSEREGRRERGIFTYIHKYMFYKRNTNEYEEQERQTNILINAYVWKANGKLRSECERQRGIFNLWWWFPSYQEHHSTQSESLALPYSWPWLYFGKKDQLNIGQV